MRKITCTSSNGLRISFDRTYNPWLLLDVEGIYESDFNVYMSENTMSDGAEYQGTTMKPRPITLTLEEKDDHEKNRQLLYDVFEEGSKGTLVYTENGSKQIEYYVEHIYITSMGTIRTATIDLMCPYPYFVDVRPHYESIAEWNPLFEWPHEFPLEGEEFEARSMDRIKTIENNASTDNIGINIEITCSGDVLNPSVTKIETGETIQVGSEDDPFTLHVGEKLLITTSQNDKHVYHIVDGEQTEVNTYLTEESEFIQLNRGTNSIGYDADSGGDYMMVLITYKYRYKGA